MSIALEKIEEIESYYLKVITKYISADINGLINRLESHNKTWNYWYPKSNNKGSTNFLHSNLFDSEPSFVSLFYQILQPNHP